MLTALTQNCIAVSGSLPSSSKRSPRVKADRAALQVILKTSGAGKHTGNEVGGSARSEHTGYGGDFLFVPF